MTATGAPRRHRRDARGGGEAHAVAEQRVALREGLEAGEAVAADVHRDVRPADVLRDQLHRREHRPLRAADAERRRAQPAAAPSSCGRAFSLVLLDRCQPMLRRATYPGAARAARGTSTGRAPAPRRCTRPPCACNPCRAASPARRRAAGSVAISCSMNSGWPSSRTSTAFLSGAELDDFLRHQRVHHVQRQGRQRAGAERVGEAQRLRARIRPLYRPPCTMMPTFSVALEDFVQLVLGNESARRRQAHVDLSFSCRKVAGGCARRS